MRKFLKWIEFPVHDHEWSKWEIQGYMVMGKEQKVIGYWQTRQCSSCGEIELKKVY